MKNQSLTAKLLVTGLLGASIVGCSSENIDYNKIESLVDDAVSIQFKAQKKQQDKDGKITEDELKKVVQFKTIEYPRFASIVAYHLAMSDNGPLSRDTLELLVDKKDELEHDLYLQTFYSALEESAGYSKDVIPLNTKNRYGFRIQNAFDMVVPQDSYFSDKYPTEGKIIISDELVPYPTCKDTYRPILLHTGLYEVGETAVIPFDINVTNEQKGWRLTFDGYRAMVDLACVPKSEKTDNAISKLVSDQ